MLRHRAMTLWSLYLLLSLFFGSTVRAQDVVHLDQDVQGTTMTTRNGRTISAYLGIPYAEPPVGELRFKSPEPWKKRDGAIKADDYGNKCPQLSDGKVIGDEDCLVLNVYTPKINPDDPYPVMVWIHGGYFVTGSGNDAAPDYLMDKDIVLVTINYRLGVFGFLATGDAAAPGNFGLKDQTLALQWVRKNIQAFGGNSKKVTIFGEGAGGASVICLAVSDASQGFFDQYIAQSGTPLGWWAFSDEFHDHYPKWSRLLGNYVNCPQGNNWELIKCLQSQDTATLVDSNDIFNDRVWVYRTWAPTTEPQNLPGVFLTHAPAELSIFKDNWIKDAPAIIGQVADEGLLLTAEFYTNDTVYDYYKSNFDDFLIRLTDDVAGNGHPKETAKKVQDFYFKDADINDKTIFTENVTNMITDADFTFPEGLNMWMMEEITSNYYVYNFGYRGSWSRTSNLTGKDDNYGVTHGDDLTYLFPNKDAKLNDDDQKMIDIMTDFWTSFATNGVPTSDTLDDPNIWKKFMPDEESLQIGKDSDPTAMSFEKPLESRSFQFWNQITIGELFEGLADSS